MSLFSRSRESTSISQSNQPVVSPPVTPTSSVRPVFVPPPLLTQPVSVGQLPPSQTISLPTPSPEQTNLSPSVSAARFLQGGEFGEESKSQVRPFLPPLFVKQSAKPRVLAQSVALEPFSGEISPNLSSSSTSERQGSIAINGFGRIGRTAFRVWWQRFRNEVPLVAINTSGSSDLETWVHLLKYDSNYGIFSENITFKVHQTKDQVSDSDPMLGTLTIDGFSIPVLAQRDPAKIPWQKYGVHTVIESTGKFLTQDSASAHLQAGAQRVVLSAPPKDEGQDGGIEMTLLGVQEILPSGKVVSNASCTTNCVAPVVAVVNTAFGVEKAMLTTIHAYTDDQNLHDNSHKDLRRSRAAALNIVPTSTGAAKAVGSVVPEMSGRFDGLAVRVPVAVGSLSDIVFVTKRDVTVDEVNAAFSQASMQSRWSGILAVTNEPLVSSDIVGRPESAIVDLSLTQVVGGNLVKVVAWYDNEFGYCNRLVEVAARA